MGNIKYLLKVVEKKKYAEQLLDGILFSNSAYYFSTLKKNDNRLNLREGALSYRSMIYTSDRYRYVYCFYTIYDDDIIDGKIVLNNEFKNKFLNKKCYMVLINYNKFIKKLDKIAKDISEIKRIDYCHSNCPTTKSSFISQHYLDKEFQREFRIVFNDSFTPKTYRRKLDGIWVEYQKRYSVKNDSKIYKIGSIKLFSKLIKNTDLW